VARPDDAGFVGEDALRYSLAAISEFDSPAATSRTTEPWEKASASPPRWAIAAMIGAVTASPAAARRKVACAPSE
jgi:hypothetical protein